MAAKKRIEIARSNIEQAVVEGRLRLNLSALDLTTEDLQKELVPNIQYLGELWMLDLNHNQLTHLPQELGHLRGLNYLSISGNKLSTLPQKLLNLSELRLINLSNNKFAGIPPELLKMPKLEDVTMDQNPGISESDVFLMNVKLNNSSKAQNITITHTKLQRMLGKKEKCFTFEYCSFQNVDFSHLPDNVLVQFKNCELDEATFRTLNALSSTYLASVWHDKNTIDGILTTDTAANKYKDIALEKLVALEAKKQQNLTQKKGGSFAEKEGLRKNMRLDGRFH